MRVTPYTNIQLANKRKIRVLNEEIEQLQKTLATDRTKTKEIINAIRICEREIEKLQKTSLILRLGRWRFQPNVNAQDAAKVFIAFHVVTIVAGLVLIFEPSPMNELGVALVVGGLFAFGTFLSSVWEKVYDDGQALDEDEPSRDHSRTSIDLEELARLLEELRDYRENQIRKSSSIQVNRLKNKRINGKSRR